MVRGAAAGALAAGIWAVQQPLDKRLFRSDYDDVELLGKLVTERPLWRVAGALFHLANGAIFGAGYAIVDPRLPGPPVARGVLAAQIEHLALWPLGRVTDRCHPARRELTTLTGNRRAFAQATWRHALFGLVLGEALDLAAKSGALATSRSRRRPDPEIPGKRRGGRKAAPSSNPGPTLAG
jgi:hypothetical protein